MQSTIVNLEATIKGLVIDQSDSQKWRPRIEAEGVERSEAMKSSYKSRSEFPLLPRRVKLLVAWTAKSEWRRVGEEGGRDTEKLGTT